MPGNDSTCYFALRGASLVILRHSLLHGVTSSFGGIENRWNASACASFLFIYACKFPPFVNMHATQMLSEIVEKLGLSLMGYFRASKRCSSSASDTFSFSWIFALTSSIAMTDVGQMTKTAPPAARKKQHAKLTGEMVLHVRCPLGHSKPVVLRVLLYLPSMDPSFALHEDRLNTCLRLSKSNNWESRTALASGNSRSRPTTKLAKTMRLLIKVAISAAPSYSTSRR